LDRIAAAGVPVLARSSFYESPFWPPRADQSDVVNAVAEVDPGARTPEALYAVLADTERALGRERRTGGAARTMDLDIVDFGGLVGDAGDLRLPHPRAHERAFVLAPLAEIAPGWRHPILAQTASELLAALRETGAGGSSGLRRLPS
jgi:2-amino-4-hydroxy-6-hydroxymethyldihydropteridine diphosphokinase